MIQYSSIAINTEPWLPIRVLNYRRLIINRVFQIFILFSGYYMTRIVIMSSLVPKDDQLDAFIYFNAMIISDCLSIAYVLMLTIVLYRTDHTTIEANLHCQRFQLLEYNEEDYQNALTLVSAIIHRHIYTKYIYNAAMIIYALIIVYGTTVLYNWEQFQYQKELIVFGIIQAIGYIQIILAIKSIVLIIRAYCHRNKSIIRQILYSQHEIDTCCICLQEFKLNERITQLGCSKLHIYHIECIAQWMSSHLSCPMCKKPIIQ